MEEPDSAQLSEQERDRLIGLIAKNHNVLLSKDDPILIIQTLHDALVDRLANTEAELLDRFASRAEEISSQWQDDAKDKAEKTLTAALAASSGAFDKRLKDATAIAVADIKNAGKELLSETEKAADTLRKSLYVVLGAVAAVLVASAFVLMASLRH